MQRRMHMFWFWGSLVILGCTVSAESPFEVQADTVLRQLGFTPVGAVLCRVNHDALDLVARHCQALVTVPSAAAGSAHLVQVDCEHAGPCFLNQASAHLLAMLRGQGL